MPSQSPKAPTPTTSQPSSDATVLDLVRAGVDVSTIYKTLWPVAPAMPLEAFAEVVKALEVADATSTPPELLPPDLEAVVDDLLVARQKIMTAIETSADVSEDGHFDAGAHIALCKNADVLLKYQSARQERQVHVLNLRVAREKQRLELLKLYDENKSN